MNEEQHIELAQKLSYELRLKFLDEVIKVREQGGVRVGMTAFVMAATHMLAGVVGAMETEQQRLAMRLFIHSQIEKDVIDAAGFMTAQAAIKKAMGVQG